MHLSWIGSFSAVVTIALQLSGMKVQHVQATSYEGVASWLISVSWW